MSWAATCNELDFLPDSLQERLLEPNQYDVYEYSLRHSSFSDYAFKSRYIFLPKGKKAVLDISTGLLEFPDGASIIKRFFYYSSTQGMDCYSPDGYLDASFADQRLDEAIAGPDCDLEVRVLRKVSGDWMPEVYRWNNSKVRYESTPSGGFQKVRLHDRKEVTTFRYSIPDLGECAQCHVGALGHASEFDIIGPSTIQRIDWRNSDLGFVDVDVSGSAREKSPLQNELARDYLDINCAHCHNPAGLAASSFLYLTKDILPTPLLGICKPVVASGVGYGSNEYDIVPGRPEESILLDRMQSVSANKKMPELGRSLRDEYGATIVAEWIRMMAGSCDSGNG